MKEEEHKSEHNALLKKHAAGREEVCAIACAATTSCRGPQRILKLPVRNINKRNSRGESVLHVASKKGDLALVRALIEAGINVNQADYAGWTALHEASAQGHSAVVQELLQSGADVNSRGLEGLTPLHDAVTSNHYETVKLLIQYGSNPNDQNVFGKTPLNLKCDKGIKELLSTFHGPFVSPEEGSSKPSSAAVRGKPAALSCENESGIQPNKESHCCTNLESTITILESVEKKQKEMSAWELTGPDDIGKFTEAFSQIQDVLNHVLNKHKAENRELTRKYRIASDSFKQGILRKQLMSLASRQKCLLRSLQKQNSLKLSVQTQSCSLLSPRPSTQLPPAGENQPGADTVPVTYIGPYRTTQQEPPLSCDSVEAPLSPRGVEVPLSPLGIEVPLNSRGVEVPLNSRGVEVPLKSQGEEVPLSSRGIEAPLSSRGAISEETPSSHSLSSLGDSAILRDSSESTHITSDTESGEPEPNVDALGSCSEVAVHRENTPCADIVLHLKSGRSETGPVQPTISANQSPSSQQTAGARSDQQRSDSIGENVHWSPQVGVLIVSNNTAYIVSSSLTDKQHTSQTHQTRPSVTPLAPSSSFLQGVNSGQPPDWVTAKQNALSVNETLAAVTACQVPDKTSLGEALSHGVQKSSCEAAVSKTLPQYGDTTVSNRQLISLIQCGVIKPGDQVLQLTLKGCTYRASLLPDGSIKDMKGQFFLSPEEWVMSLLGPNIPITSAFAWKKVTYRSKSLLMYLESPDLAASQAFPVVTPCTEETGRSSITNFMDIKKILLISHEEFMPSRLMDQYWDTFSQSEDWEI
ncbi:ankyrin repeat domain-containing protein 31-like isoform X1 [Conger conger]|uniref:ankyrin repeat domain-containing protein 31-like isoform X1 n=2 Tax=Conger conger TaxID=82655 RepID=UPI002A5B0485|nr:ankyrin repeat domain-containing protein 31-like isoform X1 [Conger conger]